MTAGAMRHIAAEQDTVSYGYVGTVGRLLRVVSGRRLAASRMYDGFMPDWLIGIFWFAGMAVLAVAGSWALVAMLFGRRPR